jgi:hypothetical protein
MGLSFRNVEFEVHPQIDGGARHPARLISTLADRLAGVSRMTAMSARC